MQMYAKQQAFITWQFLSVIIVIIKLWNRDQIDIAHEKYWEMLSEMTWVYNAQSAITGERSQEMIDIS